MPDTRYEKYPEIHIFYRGDFVSNEEQEVFQEYLLRTFYQFHRKKVSVEPDVIVKAVGI